MLFKPLHISTLKMDGKAVLEQDFGDSGAILVPTQNSKIFVHWLTDKGNIRSTYTMTYATKITGKVRMTNALDEPLAIQVLTDW